jgi:hypothetical protein
LTFSLSDAVTSGLVTVTVSVVCTYVTHAYRNVVVSGRSTAFRIGMVGDYHGGNNRIPVDGTAGINS